MTSYGGKDAWREVKEGLLSVLGRRRGYGGSVWSLNAAKRGGGEIELRVHVKTENPGGLKRVTDLKTIFGGLRCWFPVES